MRCNDDSYIELKSLTDQYYTDCKMPDISIFVTLMERCGIQVLARKDGELHEATFSIPKSVANAIVLGFRYKKNDGSFSEDLFLFEEGKSIQKGYKGALERSRLPEYKATHKSLPNT